MWLAAVQQLRGRVALATTTLDSGVALALAAVAGTAVAALVHHTETARAAREVFSLPMYPELSDEQVGRVCAALRGL